MISPGLIYLTTCEFICCFFCNAERPRFVVRACVFCLFMLLLLLLLLPLLLHADHIVCSGDIRGFSFARGAGGSVAGWGWQQRRHFARRFKTRKSRKYIRVRNAIITNRTARRGRREVARLYRCRTIGAARSARHMTSHTTTHGARVQRAPFYLYLCISML